MKTLFFKEVALEELNSHGTDFWTGVGIGTGVVGAGRSSWCTNCCDVMDMNKNLLFIIIPVVIVFGLIVLVNSSNLYMNIALATTITLASGILVGRVLQLRKN